MIIMSFIRAVTAKLFGVGGPWGDDEAAHAENVSKGMKNTPGYI